MSKNILRVIAVLILFAVTSTKNFAQADTNSVKPYIVACADSMTKSFIKKDIETAVRFMNDSFLIYLGGKDKYIAFVKQQYKDPNPTLGKPPKPMHPAVFEIRQVVQTENGFQTILMISGTAIMRSKKIKSSSGFFGSSDPSGKKWKFLSFDSIIADFNSIDISSIKSLVPDFDKRLIIPKNEETEEDL